MFSAAHDNLRNLKRRLDSMDSQIMDGNYDSAIEDVTRNLKMLDADLKQVSKIVEDLISEASKRK